MWCWKLVSESADGNGLPNKRGNTWHIVTKTQHSTFRFLTVCGNQNLLRLRSGPWVWFPQQPKLVESLVNVPRTLPVADVEYIVRIILAPTSLSACARAKHKGRWCDGHCLSGKLARKDFPNQVSSYVWQFSHLFEWKVRDEGWKKSFRDPNTMSRIF